MLNNPINIIDPLGLDPVGEWIKKIYFRKWWWQLRIWDDERIYHRDDGAGNTMAKRTENQMKIFYLNKAKSQKLISSWKHFTLTPEKLSGMFWYIYYDEKIDFNSAGFWLYQCNQVEVLGGSYEARCKGDMIEIKNSKGRFRWNDRIDSNAKRERSWAYLLELLNEIPEYITGADFSVSIDWQDDNKEVRGKKRSEIH